jgi:hypothetical protein
VRLQAATAAKARTTRQRRAQQVLAEFIRFTPVPTPLLDVNLAMPTPGPGIYFVPICAVVMPFWHMDTILASTPVRPKSFLLRDSKERGQPGPPLAEIAPGGLDGMDPNLITARTAGHASDITC